MMEATMPSVPPFETFYEAHRDEILGYLRRIAGRDAEDAFQETFLRALRGYATLRHGRELRAWVFTIATRVVIDARRRREPPLLAEPATEDGRPAYAQLEHLTSTLPPTERAAVVLRYGYDLAYDTIAEALGSSPEAARAAASSGVRRLRKGTA
jgi:RNA polymerase sigma factor (sigma-70 family)